MIHIERTETPKALYSPMIREWKNSAETFFGRHQSKRTKRSQERFHFEDVRRIEGLGELPLQLFNTKCAYCESRINFFDAYEIANFRPRGGATNLDGSSSPDHYWWLAYEWFNLYVVCTTCNKLKGSRFPVQGARCPINATAKELLNEQILLLDPCVDYPEEELIFDENGKVASSSIRGRVTIDILNLNRTDLVDKRGKHLQWLKGTFQKTAEQQQELISPASFIKAWNIIDDAHLEYLAMTRQFLQQWSLEALEKNPDLEESLKPFLAFRTALKHQLFPIGDTSGSAKPTLASIEISGQGSVSAKEMKGAIKQTVEEFQAHQVAQENYSLEDESRKRDYFRKTRLIESIEIHNFKVIQDLYLKFPLDSPDKGSWLLLLGENATGKSTVLQAVALALMGGKARKNFEETRDASRFVHYGCEEGYIRVTLTGISTPIEITFRKNSKIFRSKDKSKDRPQVLLLGYGATRLLPRRGSLILEDADTGFSKPYNLFNPFIPLTDASSWLYGLKGDFFTSAAIALKELLLLKGEDDRIIKEHRTKRIQIERKVGKGKKETVYLEDLSAGYQSVLALSTDIMSVLFRLWDMPDAMRFAEGIVLLDEIDAHLHPRWKMQIVQRLRNCFPRVQFFVTSHEPLILRGLNEHEVAVMRRDNDDYIHAIVDNLPNPKALRVDQLLTSEFFGLYSTIDAETEAKFNEYYALLAKEKRTKTEQQRVTALKKELDGLKLMGATPREQIMLKAVDEYLAKQTEVNGDKRIKLKSKVHKKLLAILEKTEGKGRPS